MTTPVARASAITAAALLAAAGVAIPLIVKHEGERRVGYLDPIGVSTACVGHTRTAIVGKIYSEEDCQRLLMKDFAEHASGIAKCITVPVPTESLAAFVSFSFNVGVSAFCSSTLARKLNAGDLSGACSELSRWVYAGGKRWPGLQRRRADERALCEMGLPQTAVVSDTSHRHGWSSRYMPYDGAPTRGEDGRQTT